MAKVEINPGICGLPSTVWAELDPATYRCKVTVESECAAIRKMGVELEEVDPFQEIALRRGDGPLTLRKAQELCSHSSCPVPSGIIKVVEVAAGLALPADVTMKLSKED